MTSCTVCRSREHRVRRNEEVAGSSRVRGRGDRATFVNMTFVNMVKRIEEQGFTVARLEDYIAPPAG
ncbi:hypothetical protein ABH931_007224 [Streptacidiphilus sp. MAP12-33]